MIDPKKAYRLEPTPLMQYMDSYDPLDLRFLRVELEGRTYFLAGYQGPRSRTKDGNETLQVYRGTFEAFCTTRGHKIGPHRLAEADVVAAYLDQHTETVEAL